MDALMAIGRSALAARLEEEVPLGAFEENGVRWWPALHGRRSLQTRFGAVVVRRPVFRDRRNGPTRCLIAERLGLIESWTPGAARAGARLVAQLPSRSAQAVWAELTGAAPSRSSLDRLPRLLSRVWEEDREALETKVSEATPIPQEATQVCVSLDGVFAPMRGEGKAEHKAHQRARGRPDKGLRATVRSRVASWTSAMPRDSDWRHVDGHACRSPARQPSSSSYALNSSASSNDDPTSRWSSRQTGAPTTGRSWRRCRGVIE